MGYVARMALEEARKGEFDVVVAIAGNNKDAPEEIPRLLDPICEEGYDFVMGSRYLAGGEPAVFVQREFHQQLEDLGIPREDLAGANEELAGRFAASVPVVDAAE